MVNPVINRAKDHVVSAAKVDDTNQEVDEEMNEEVVSDADVDEESKKGRFGWEEVDAQLLPYIFRKAGDRTEKFCTVTMVERMLLNRLMDVLPNEVISCTNVLGFPATEAEKTVLNHIIRDHCEPAQFEVDVGTVVRLEDAIDYYKFLKFCHQKIVSTVCNGEDKCGFLKVNGDGVIPFVTVNNNKFLPLFYFEEGEEASKLEAVNISDWDLTYLKFCCKVQGIQRELVENRSSRVVDLGQVKAQFDEEATFEECWPQDGRIEAKSELKSPMKPKEKSIISWQQDDASKPPTTIATGNDPSHLPANSPNNLPANYPPGTMTNPSINMPTNYPNRPPTYPNQPLNYPNRAITPPYPNRATTPPMSYPNRPPTPRMNFPTRPTATFPAGYQLNFPTNNPAHAIPVNLPRMNSGAARPANMPPNFSRNLPSTVYQQQQQQFLYQQLPQNRFAMAPRQVLPHQNRNQAPSNGKRIRMTMG